MEKTIHSRVWLEIDLGVLQENYRKMVAAVAPCSVIAVLKANAYGLGVGAVAKALVDAGCRQFGVAELNEALELRALGGGENSVDRASCPICSVSDGQDVHPTEKVVGDAVAVQILGGVLPDEVPAAIEAGVILPITDIEIARHINRVAGELGKIAECQFLVDTGMGRLGVPLENAVALVCEVAELQNLECEGIYSHFPIAYRGGDEYTNKQIDDFKSLLENLAGESIEFSCRHIANSDAINNFPRAYALPFNAVRSGINLHGCFDTEGQRILDIKPALTLKSRLIAVRELSAGDHIGYGCSYCVPHDMRVGVVAAGYADGLPLALSNTGYLLVSGVPCKVLGRVSMDYTTISLEGVDDATCGDDVICLGGSGEDAVTVEDWAEIKNTHPYDIICSFGSRVERRYVGRTLNDER